MIFNNKSPKKIGVGKNILPNFNSPDWFGDDSAVGGEMTVDAFNPHKMQLKLTQSAQGRLIQIPVKTGQAYTISFKTITGLFRLYKGKAKHHDIAITIVQDAVPKPFTFVVDASYNGYVTLRLTQGMAGTFTFENLQIEEGYANTAFEPYLESNKASVKVPRTSLISIDPAKWTQGVRQQSQDISASNYRITFNDAFPKVKPNRTYKLVVKAGYKFGAFLFGKDGKMLLDSKWQYSDYTFTTPSDEGVVVTLNGGLSNDGALTPSRISDSGMMLYDVTDLVARPAKLVPVKNLVPMDLSKWEVRPNTTNVKIEGTKISFQATATYAGVNFYLDPKTYGGKTITFSRGEISSGATATIFYRKADGGTAYIGLVANTSTKVDVPLGVTELRFYVQNADELVLGKTYYAYDLQAELGSAATPYSAYAEGTKKPVSTVKKAPYRTYPFNFKRESIETVNGLQYGQNNPRIINGGLMVEEGTTNLVPPATSWTVPWVAQLPAQYFDDYVRLTLDTTKGTIAGVKMAKTFSATGGKNYTIRFKARANRDGVSLNYTYYLGGGFSNGNKALSTVGFRPSITTEWKEYSFTTTYDSTTSAANVLFGLYNANGNVTGDYVDFKDIQVEQKDYPTSVTNGTRKDEVPTLNVTFDRQAGSIETEFDFADIPSRSQYIFDTVQNRWIFYKDAWDNNVYVYLDGVSCISLPKSVLPNGRIKARIEWSNPNVKLYINDVLVGTGTYLGSNYTTKDMYLGTRYTVVEYLNNVIYSCVVKDRNGNIIASM